MNRLKAVSYTHLDVYKRQPMGHGSQYQRGVGSLGTMLPMHVLKGKKMPGQMGNVARTVQNLEIISVEMCIRDSP